jgi:hypothetical protein
MIRKSKSTLPDSCSTPNIVIAKEVEFANNLFKTGNKLQKSSSMLADASPIVSSAIVSKKPAMLPFQQSKQTPSFAHTPMANAAVSLTRAATTTPVFDHLSRNLIFEEEGSHENEKKQQDKVETSELDMNDEDEELMAHMTEVESRSNTTLNIDKSLRKYKRKSQILILLIFWH